jgi:glycyl-tRNA synthetase beta chain
MPQFLLELFSEEIPARMQAAATRDLERLAGAGLSEVGLAFDRMAAFAGPRRLTLVVDGLPLLEPKRKVERKGPRLGAPAAAIEGFLRSAGVGAESMVERDGAYFVLSETGGRPTARRFFPLAEVHDLG